VQVARDTAALLILHAQHLRRKFAKLLFCLLAHRDFGFDGGQNQGEFAGAIRDFFFQVFVGFAQLAFDSFQVSDVQARGVKEDNFLVIVANGMNCEFDQAFRAIRPVILENGAIRGALRRLLGRVFDG
jgi:hypothetical protein